MPPPDRLSELLDRKGYLVIDGALATELEARGHDLNHPLWSAKILQETPQAIQDVHRDYFTSGADIAITASYQASPLGLSQHLSLTDPESTQLIAKSVEIALAARDFSQTTLTSNTNLIAGSVGPYGAYLADGSEYRGDYSIPPETLQAFHRPRIAALQASGIDLLACETLPSFAEIECLVTLLRDEFPTLTAWFSFTLRSATQLSDGTPLSRVLGVLDSCSQVVAVGVNCVPAQGVTEALRTLRAWTSKPLLVYPNSGETWDAQTKTWSGDAARGSSLEHDVREWYKVGARLIGGCCRTGPETIRVIAETLREIVEDERR